MIDVSVADSRTLKNIFESIAEIVDEAAFIFDNDCFRIDGADPSIISKVEVYLKNSFFMEYNVDTSFEFGVDMVSLDKIAKRIQGPDTVRLISRDRENILEIVLNGGIERKFDASLIELNNNLPRIDIAFPVAMELDTEVFRNCIKDLAVAGGSVTFDVSDDALVMSSIGELGNAVITISKDNESLRDVTIDRPCSARYNLSYLVSFLKAGQISDTIHLSMGEKDYPLKLEFSFEHGNMIFYLAPMEY